MLGFIPGMTTAPASRAGEAGAIFSKNGPKTAKFNFD